MKVALFGKNLADSSPKDLKDLIGCFKQGADTLYLHQNFKEVEKSLDKLDSLSADYFSSYEELDTSFDFLISIGGDGTFLDSTLLVRDLNIPILGINTGRLGFLSNTATSEIEEAIGCLRSGNFEIDQRSLLRLDSESNLFKAQNHALNEISILKRDTSSMISIEVKINDEMLNTYWADGLIIATATGSTAYSLSCGGPILMPGGGNFVITPIAPHNLNVRPMVIDDDVVLKIKADGRADKSLVALDSRSEELLNQEEISIQKADYQIGIVQIDKHNFINSLKAKLNWGLDRRNK